MSFVSGFASFVSGLASFVSGLASKLGGGSGKEPEKTYEKIHKNDIMPIWDCTGVEHFKPVTLHSKEKDEPLSDTIERLCGLITLRQHESILNKLADENGDIEIGACGHGVLSDAMPDDYVPEVFFNVETGKQFVCYQPATKLACVKLAYDEWGDVRLQITSDNKPHSGSTFKSMVIAEHTKATLEHLERMYVPPAGMDTGTQANEFWKFTQKYTRLGNQHCPPNGIVPAFLALRAANRAANASSNASLSAADQIALLREQRKLNDSARKLNDSARKLVKEKRKLKGTAVLQQAVTVGREAVTGVREMQESDSEPSSSGTFVRARQDCNDCVLCPFLF